MPSAADRSVASRPWRTLAKRFGRNLGKRSAVKKAYVTLAEGTIDFFGV